MCVFIYITITLKTLAADGKQKRIINGNVIPVVSALPLSITHYINTKVCIVFKWQQLGVARKWTRCSLEDFSLGFAFALLFFSRNCMFYLKQLLHMQ